MAIRHQPGVPLILNEGNWMTKPAESSDIPQGLEYLALVDEIKIKQKKEMIEIFLGWETNNKYVIMNGAGEQIYYAFEETDTCSRQCCGKYREFTIHIVDNTGREVMRVCREFKWCAGWSCCAEPMSCAAHVVTVEAPPGKVIGFVSQRPSCCIPAYQVLDQIERGVLNIDPPECCDQMGCGDQSFSVNTFNNEEIGAICKNWAGCCQESFTDADNFGITFPLDLSVRTKALLIGATFLIDFVHFEK